jgi:hypothetical protein
VADRARRLLLTHEGRVVLFGVYVVAAVASIATYAVKRSAGYAIGQTILFTVYGALMVMLVRRRGSNRGSTSDQAAVDDQ